MGHKGIAIVKMTGEKAEFDQSKLRRSLERSGAGDLVIKQILGEVVASLYDGISTKEIYKTAFTLLRKSSRPTAARYKLKKAIMELGPTGYPFEKFVGEILKHQGFEVKVGVMVKGSCVMHEVDVVAEKDNKHFMIECKFHSHQDRYCDVKVPLYIQSRFKDVEQQWKKQPGHDTKFHQGWIFNNTRFTSDAIKYGNCAGLILIGWDYPKKRGLKERIDISGLHPVTCLTTLSKVEKQQLLNKNIVLCKMLHHNQRLFESIGVRGTRLAKAMKECEELCSQFSTNTN